MINGSGTLALSWKLVLKAKHYFNQRQNKRDERILWKGSFFWTFYEECGFAAGHFARKIEIDWKRPFHSLNTII